jgi:hypothetical protein
MTIALAGGRQRAGVTVAEVNLKFIWDVVSQIQDRQGRARHVVDSDVPDRACPDISLVSRPISRSWPR